MIRDGKQQGARRLARRATWDHRRIGVRRPGILLVALLGFAPIAPPAGAQAPAGAFRITQAQAADLQISAVARVDVQDQLTAEGKIALDGDRITPVFSPFSGRVLRVLAAPGDRVRAGSPLLVLDASEFAQARADLRSALAAQATARAQVALGEAGEARRHALYDAKVGALQDWQQAQSDLAAARSSLASADAALALVRDRLRILGKSQHDIDALAAQTDPPGDTSITLPAPISGTVTDRQVGVGQFLPSGTTTPVFSIGDLSRVWLLAYVRESESAGLRPGLPVAVRIPAIPGRRFQARLNYVAPTLDPTTHRLPVRAEIANPEGVLKPEMLAEFTITTGPRRKALRVPEAAVVHDGTVTRVWVESAPLQLVAREIRIRSGPPGQVEVVAGLQPGERIVTRGTLFIDRAAAGD